MHNLLPSRLREGLGVGIIRTMPGRLTRIIAPTQLAQARDLRSNGTRHEAMLWSRLRNSGCGHKFSRQISIGPWIADFVCRQHQLIVELDGGCHDVERDARRDLDLLARGYRVLRIPNWALDEDVDGVVRQIVAAIEGIVLTAPPPAPPASGRGAD